MSLSTYYPNSTNCDAWRDATGSSAWLDYTYPDPSVTHYNGTELSTISTDDNNYVAATTAGGINRHVGHKILFKIAEAVGSISKVTLTVKVANNINGNPWYLSLGAYNGTGWAMLYTLDNQGSGTKATYTYDITGNITNYISGGNFYALVQDKQPGPSGTTSCNLYYAKLDVTYALPVAKGRIALLGVGS